MELAYDSLLRGKPGLAKCELLVSRWVYVPVVEPQDGLDVTTTLDIEMQDIAERALVDKLVEIDAASGCVLLMDVVSGEVKACVNMSRVAPGEYREIVNMAVGDMSDSLVWSWRMIHCCAVSQVWRNVNYLAVVGCMCPWLSHKMGWMLQRL